MQVTPCFIHLTLFCKRSATMKRTIFRKTLIAAVLAGTTALGTTALAQPPQGSGMGPGMMGGMMGPGMMGGYGPGYGMGPGCWGFPAATARPNVAAKLFSV